MFTNSSSNAVESGRILLSKKEGGKIIDQGKCGKGKVFSPSARTRNEQTNVVQYHFLLPLTEVNTSWVLKTQIYVNNSLYMSFTPSSRLSHCV